jgi:hypothetical protein
VASSSSLVSALSLCHWAGAVGRTRLTPNAALGNPRVSRELCSELSWSVYSLSEVRGRIEADAEEAKLHASVEMYRWAAKPSGRADGNRKKRGSRTLIGISVCQAWHSRRAGGSRSV